MHGCVGLEVVAAGGDQVGETWISSRSSCGMPMQFADHVERQPNGEIAGDVEFGLADEAVEQVSRSVAGCRAPAR